MASSTARLVEKRDCAKNKLSQIGLLKLENQVRVSKKRKAYITMRLSEIASSSGVSFGTSGARGLVSAITPEVCSAYIEAFINAVAHDASEVVIGYDLRPSSPAIAAVCAGTIHKLGLRVINVGALPTPAVAFYASLLKLPAIVITGSHIPFDRNGIKFYKKEGEISKSDESLMMMHQADCQQFQIGSSIPAADPNGVSAYVSRYSNFFGSTVLAGKRIGVYEHSSVARDVVKSILTLLGAEVISLGRTSAFIPIDTEAVRQEDVEQARAWAAEHKFDAIVSTDGDGDRPMIGDEQGRWLRGDIVGVLCAKALKASIVVTPVSSNTVAEKCGIFGKVIRTRIGSPYVIEGMQSAAISCDGGAVVIGYEANGGVLLGTDIKEGARELKALNTRDALLPIVATLVMAAERKCSVSTLLNDLPTRFTASGKLSDVSIAATKKLIDSLVGNPDLASRVMGADAGGIASVDVTDGLRLTFGTSDIVHLRISGNAPELRCYSESETAERAQILCDRCLEHTSKILSEKCNPFDLSQSH